MLRLAEIFPAFLRFVLPYIVYVFGFLKYFCGPGRKHYIQVMFEDKYWTIADFICDRPIFFSNFFGTTSDIVHSTCLWLLAAIPR